MLFRTMGNLGRRFGRAAGLAVAVSAMAVAFGGQALAAGDAAKGEETFKKNCFVCHSLEDKVKVGPSLHGVVGRKAGTYPGFAYSDANKNSGLTWDEATLEVYLTDPKAKVPGTKMIFMGLKNADDRANVIAYLSTLK